MLPCGSTPGPLHHPGRWWGDQSQDRSVLIYGIVSGSEIIRKLNSSGAGSVGGGGRARAGRDVDRDLNALPRGYILEESTEQLLAFGIIKTDFLTVVRIGRIEL